MKPTRKIPEAKPLFLERMKKLLPDKTDFQSYLNILKTPPVKSIRCNELKISPQELKEKLKARGWQIKQPWKNNPEVMIVEGKIPTHTNLLKQTSDFSLTTSNKSVSKASLTKGGQIGNLQDLEPGEVGRALEHQLGYYYMQELASMLPVIALEPKKNEKVLDLCAAPGSKTTQLSSAMQGTGMIVANEVSMGRLKILASNLEKCSAINTIITRKEGFALCKRIEKYNPALQFDKILVDAPCSGEGTLRSSYKTYLMWNVKTIKNLPKIQKGLVASALKILKHNGVLIYSTCTHAPEENEGVTDAILKEFKGKIKLEKISLPIKTREGITKWEDKKFSDEVKKCARVYPQDNDTEGFFIAKFRRLG